MIITLTCRECGAEGELHEFVPSKTGKHGREKICKVCRYKQQLLRRQGNIVSNVSTLCWDCANCYPSKCTWPKKLELPEGVTVKKCVIRESIGKKRLVETSKVIKCPRFERESGGGHEQTGEARATNKAGE